MNREELEAKIERLNLFIDSTDMAINQASDDKLRYKSELTDLEAQLASLSDVWKPEIGQPFWIINTCGGIKCWVRGDEPELEDRAIAFGNCYRTEAEAVYVRDNQLTLTKLRRFADEHNPSDFDVLDNKVKRFYMISTHMNVLRLSSAACSQMISSTLPMFANKPLSNQATKEIGSLNIAKLFFTYDEWQRVVSEFDISGLE